MMMKRFGTKIKIFCFAVSFLGLNVLSGCYQMLQPKIPMQNNNAGNATLGQILGIEVPLEKLPAPKKIYVSQAMFSDRIKVSWTKVSGAESYYLERAKKKISDDLSVKPEDDEYQILKASATNLSASDFLLAEEYTDVIDLETDGYDYVYYYRVRAENAFSGYESSPFADSFDNGIDGRGYLFAPPVSVTASAGENSDFITVSWSSVSDTLPWIKKPSTYRIYRSNDPANTSSVLIKTVFGNIRSFSNVVSAAEQGSEFYYTIEACNSEGMSSERSSVAMGYALKAGAPGRVNNVVISEAKGRGDSPKEVSIEWEPVSVAESEVQYSVYRLSSKDSSLTQVAKGLKNVTSFTDKKLKPNTYYYYRVMAYVEKDGEVLKGPLSLSGPDEESPCEGFILSVPEDLAVETSGNSTTLKFPKVIGEQGFSTPSKIEGTNIIYSFKVLGGQSPDSLSSVGIYSSTDIHYDPLSGNYTLKDMPSFNYYKIVTINSEGKESAESKLAAPSPKPATGVSVTKAAFIEGVTTSAKNANKNGVYPVKIKWIQPVGGADGGYYVYRSDNRLSGFKRITENPVFETEIIEEDFNATKPGVVYYYKVLSLNSLGGGSNYSEAASGYGALTYDQYMREYNKTIKRSQKKLTLMHVTDDMKKLGTETKNGDIRGTISYDASIAGLGASIVMHYEDYADFYVESDNPSSGFYFHITGNTDTSASMDRSGKMSGTVICHDDGMYPGKVEYDYIQIKGGNAGGGKYVITPKGFAPGDVEYKVGNE